MAECEEYAKASGATITLTEDVAKGAQDADVIYTDVWVSMGEPDAVWAERIRALLPYQVNKKVMTYAKDSAIFTALPPGVPRSGYEDRQGDSWRNSDWMRWK